MTSFGGLWCWGGNGAGQLGIGVWANAPDTSYGKGAPQSGTPVVSQQNSPTAVRLEAGGLSHTATFASVLSSFVEHFIRTFSICKCPC